VAYRRPVNAFDVVLLLTLVIAIIGGLRVGLVARAATWVGLVVGVVLASRTVPLALGWMDGGEPTLRLLLGLGVLAVTVSLSTTLFQSFGLRARHRLARTPLSGIDRAAGSVAGAVAVVLLAWLLVPAAADVPGEVARQVRNSEIAALLAERSPEPPDATRTLRALLDTSRFPEVFADLQPAPDTGPPPERIAVPEEVVAQATASTVNVEARGCGRRYEGSGFAVAVDTVITNAHVVAGASEVVVRRPDGASRLATVVVFDPDRDLALLVVDDLGQQPLPLAGLAPGDDAVVIGYPGGQNAPRPMPAQVSESRTALGRDIYGREPTERQVLFLATSLRQGDSGSPVVGTDGSVGGVVFAISPDNPSLAYALDLPELEALLAAPREAGEAGACV
jgi:S1-C subfamily serine protease